MCRLLTQVTPHFVPFTVENYCQLFYQNCHKDTPQPGIKDENEVKQMDKKSMKDYYS
jgi:hypothetical protein